MSIKILINANDPEECRVAIVKANKLEEFYTESALRETTQGNIYKGIITRIEPSLQAVFVDYGAERHGFLQRHEIHSDYFQDSEGGDLKIEKIVKRGQEVMVQVTKEPFMKKGAMLTTYISLAGRYLVLMPGSDKIGVSRKIEDEDERSRLKDLVGKLTPPEGFGLIVRTVGVSSTRSKIPFATVENDQKEGDAGTGAGASQQGKAARFEVDSGLFYPRSKRNPH